MEAKEGECGDGAELYKRNPDSGGRGAAAGGSSNSGASVSLTEEQAETVTEYFTETSPAGSGLLENLRLRLGLPSFAADPTDTSDPTGIATSSDVVTPSMKGL